MCRSMSPTGVSPSHQIRWVALLLSCMANLFGIALGSTTANGPPSILFRQTSQLTGTSVEFQAYFRTNGSSTVGWIEWGETKALGNTTPQRGVASPNPYLRIEGELIKGLKPATLYYFRPVAMNDFGVTRDTMNM